MRIIFAVNAFIAKVLNITHAGRKIKHKRNEIKTFFFYTIDA